MPSFSDSKSMAKVLRKVLEEHGLLLSNSACLEIVARQFGFANWQVLSAACENERQLTVIVYVEHGRQREAAAFYRAAFRAAHETTHEDSSTLYAIDLDFGEMKITVSGANPKREAEPHRGGPFFPKANGAVNPIVSLTVKDAEKALQQAIAAGGMIRHGLEISDERKRVASFFDPFGHVWALSEKQSVKISPRELDKLRAAERARLREIRSVTPAPEPAGHNF
ncbi:glyoxalase superfamily protein [Mesorhizobium sp. M1334]|uniref:glyoxalase superfamily protein n=1 Tax=Mesorhizobium sp. M1334 TaxID=2957084 RepID=UPI003334E3B6